MEGVSCRVVEWKSDPSGLQRKQKSNSQELAQPTLEELCCKKGAEKWDDSRGGWYWIKKVFLRWEKLFCVCW